MTFANVTLPWVKNCQNIKINLATCLILSVAGFDQTLWRPFCRETARVSTARVVRGVSPGVPQWGGPEGAELLTAQNTGVPNVTLHSAPWGRPKGTSWYIQIGKTLPTPLQNTLKRTLFSFRKRKIRDFAGPLGDTPKVTLRKSCLAPADNGR